MRLDTIVAYTYRADTYCPRCTINLIHDDDATPDRSICVNAYWMGDAETVLDGVAEARGINRYDERSYDSDDFPKVVFADQLLEPGDDGYPERCPQCHRELGQ